MEELLQDPFLAQVPTEDGAKVLDVYVLLERIGTGGVGSVYRARHRTMEVERAIKCLRPAVSGAESLQRFEREARIAASVEHRHLVQVYDIRHAHGLHYIVMELVRGQTLAELVKARGPLATEEACRMVRDAARGLAIAHTAGIVHRDVKPANVMVTHEGVVKVVDLGLAKATDQADVLLTGSNAFLGTPQYMSPEHYDGVASVGARGDVYALGATLAFLLTGRDPFNDLSSSQIMMNLFRDGFPADHLVLAGVPRHVIELITTATAADASERHADAGAFVEHLVLCLEQLGARSQASPVDTTGAVSSVVPAAAQRAPAAEPAAAATPMGDDPPTLRCWYTRNQAGVSGPHGSNVLRTLARRGALLPEDLVARSPNGPWYAASRVQGLFDTPVPVSRAWLRLRRAAPLAAAALLALTMIVWAPWDSAPRQPTGGWSTAPVALPDLTADAHFARGCELVATPEGLELGIAHLERADALEPGRPGSDELLISSLCEWVTELGERGRRLEAARLARRLRARYPEHADVGSVTDAALTAIAELVRIRGPLPGDVLSGATAKVEGRIDGSLRQATLRIAGEEVRPVGGRFEHVVDDLADGVHAISAQLTWPDGLIVPVPLSLTVDMQPPELTVDAPLPGAVVRDRVTLSGSVFDTTACRLTVDDRVVEVGDDGRWEVDLRAEEGERAFRVVAVDALGQHSEQVLPVVVDGTPPAIETFGRGFDQVFRDPGSKIEVRVTDAHLATVAWDGQPVPVGADGLLRLELPLNEDQQPAASVLHLTDEAGHQTLQTFTARLDWDRPRFVIPGEPAEVFPDEGYTLLGTYADASPCELVMGGVTHALEGGMIRVPYRVPGDAKPGTTFAAPVVVRDAAGNERRGEHTFRIREPCNSYRPVDHLRGVCTDCDGDKRVDGDCPPPCEAGVRESDCRTCDGTGHPKCEHCGGSGDGLEGKCPICEGTPPDCKRCVGDRRITCTTCRGSGKGSQPTIGLGFIPKCGTCKGQRVIDCPSCKGKGIGECPWCDRGMRTLPCTHCTDGRSKQSCKVCNQGLIRESCRECTGGRRLVDCSHCHGTGDCPTCRGTGEAP